MKTYGIGGSTPEAELAAIQPKAHLVDPIQKSEFQTRIQKSAHLLRENKVTAMYLHAGINLYYFTGTHCKTSERITF